MPFLKQKKTTRNLVTAIKLIGQALILEKKGKAAG